MQYNDFYVRAYECDTLPFSLDKKDVHFCEYTPF